MEHARYCSYEITNGKYWTEFPKNLERVQDSNKKFIPFFPPQL